MTTTRTRTEAPSDQPAPTRRRAGDPSPAAGLAGRLRGRLVTPADEGWDVARAAWNLAADQRPEAVVFPVDAADTAEVVRWAAAAGYRVAPQSGGHNPGPLGDLTGTVLLRTSAMAHVVVDVPAHRVRVGAGVLWGQVTEALAAHGQAALAGSSPDVGVTGYTLSGGYSWFARGRGLAVSSVLSAEVVTGDGRVLRVDAEHEPEVFWAVRGGGGNGVVVTELELATFDATQVVAGALLFPLERAAEVLSAFAAWSLDLDEAVTACVRLLRLPPLPELPEALRGRAFVVVDGAVDADEERARELLAPMRALGPEVDLVGPVPVPALAAIHMDPPAPTPAAGQGTVLTALTPETVAALLAVAGPAAETSLLAVDRRMLGGAVSRPAVGGGAVDHLPGAFLAFGVGITPDAAAHRRVRADLDRLLAALAPWTAERTYANFSETSEPASRFHATPVLARLRTVQRAVDPGGVVRANHPLG